MNQKPKKVQRIHVLIGILVILLGIMAFQFMGGSEEPLAEPATTPAVATADTAAQPSASSEDSGSKPAALAVDRTIPKSFYGTDPISLSYQPFTSD